MTPTKKGKTTCIKIEKVRKTLIDEQKVQHTGGGQNSGLVINKQASGTYSTVDLGPKAGMDKSFSDLVVHWATTVLSLVAQV